MRAATESPLGSQPPGTEDHELITLNLDTHGSISQCDVDSNLPIRAASILSPAPCAGGISWGRFSPLPREPVTPWAPICLDLQCVCERVWWWTEHTGRASRRNMGMHVSGGSPPELCV